MASPCGQIWRAMVSETIATAALETASARVNARPRRTPIDRTLKYSSETNWYATGTLLAARSADLSDGASAEADLSDVASAEADLSTGALAKVDAKPER